MRELTGMGQRNPEKGEDYSDANYDEWSGYSGSLFSGGGGDDAEDKEADKVFSKIDEFVENKREKKRLRKQEELEQKITK